MLEITVFCNGTGFFTVQPLTTIENCLVAELYRNEHLLSFIQLKVIVLYMTEDNKYFRWR